MEAIMMLAPVQELLHEVQKMVFVFRRYKVIPRFEMNMQVIYLRVLSLHRAEMVTAPKDTGFA
jgi:hypothetical protein